MVVMTHQTLSLEKYWKLFPATLSVEVFSTAVLIVDTEISKQILQIEQKLVKNSNWREANRLAINKAWRS